MSKDAGSVFHFMETWQAGAFVFGLTFEARMCGCMWHWQMVPGPCLLGNLDVSVLGTSTLVPAGKRESGSALSPQRTQQNLCLLSLKLHMISA